MELAKEYVINDPEDLLECPYDSAHMVRAKRLAYHIAKCRVHHACAEMDRCPFNASHEVYKVEMRYHMAICEDKDRVQGKIAQERFEREGEVKGCIETPGYKPLNIWGDSWEDDTTTESCFTSGKVELKERPKTEQEEAKAEEEKVVLTDAETQGLTGRQVQKLYLQKQAELKQAKEQAAQKKPAVEEKLRVPRQASQSLAIHHQQQHRQQQDIYQQALKGQQDRAFALGRGRGLLLGTNPLHTGGAVPGAGRGLVGNGTSQPQNMGPLHAALNGNVPSAGHTNPQNSGVCKPAGRGWGNVNVNAPSVGRPPSGGMMDVTNLMGPAGRGIGNVQTQLTAGNRPIGVVGDLKSAVRPPDAVGAKIGGSNPQGEVVGLSHVAASMGRGAGSSFLFNSGAVGPLQGLPGSAENTTPQYIGSTNYPPQSQQYMSSSSETEDDSQYQDAPAWVGGGYGGDLDPSPSFSLSSTSMNSNYQAAAASRSGSATSMASNPKIVGSWADEVDKSFPMPTPVLSSDSLSSDSDFPDVQRTETVGVATKQLRKLRKKLRQIDELDAKKRQGVALDPASEARLQSRATLIAQAAHLQQKFGLP